MALQLYTPTTAATATTGGSTGQAAGSRDEEEIKKVQEKISNLRNNVRR